jgi:hypothetical protein
MRNLDIRNALVLSWLDGDFGLPTAYPNKDPNDALKQAQANNQPWADLSLLPSQPGVATCGDEGMDRHGGVLQIDLNHPLNSGDVPAITLADQIARRYKAGEHFDAPALSETLIADFQAQEFLVWDPLPVLIRSCGYEQPRRVENWSRTTMTIYYSAWVSRA